MIYFDNAATVRNKPEAVFEAFNYFVREIGTSPGRGSYTLGVQSSRMLYQTRRAVSDFFGAKSSSDVVFTKNATEAINLYLCGALSEGDHVVISPYEHNAVLRPLHALAERGVITYTILPESVLYQEKATLPLYIKENTKLLVLTLASNLTGQYVFNRDLAKIAHTYNLDVFVDASQGGGKKIVQMQEDEIDVLAFTGHKDLLGLPGVGGLCANQELEIRPLLQGGTGVHGDQYTNPSVFPDMYEAGTLNMPAIWALKAGLAYIDENFEDIKRIEQELVNVLIEGLKKCPNVILYNINKRRVPTVCFNIQGKSSSDVVAILDKKGVCVRGGIHCAILAHETLNTVSTGAVRVSVCARNTYSEVIEFLGIIKEL